MYEDFFKAIYNTVVVLGGSEDILSIIDKGSEMSLDELTKELHRFNSEKIDDMKGQVLKFKGIEVVNGEPFILR